MAGSKGKGSRAGYQKRQRAGLSYIMNPFYEAPSSYDELVKDYRTLAKAADQRLVRLEKYVKEEGFGHAQDYAYRRAMHDIKAWGGGTRWNRRPPESMAKLKAKMQDIKTFLMADTSTKGGLRSVEQRRADTLNEKFGTDFTPAEISKFFDSKLRKKMEDKVLDSNTMVKTIAVMRRNKSVILQKGKSRKKKLEEISQAERDRFTKDVKEANERDIDAPDEMVESLIDTILEKHGPTVRAYLKGAK